MNEELCNTKVNVWVGVQNLVEVVEGLETLKYLEIIDLADNMVTLP
jgi:hypothetical protein